MEQAERSMAALDAIRELCVGLILDDFGTGYSSLSYLQQLPIDTVKLDRSFIAELQRRDSAATAIVSAVVQMARALKLNIVAEGVETAEQAAEVRRLGCDLAQGWLYGRPGPLSQLPAAAQPVAPAAA